MQLEGKIINFLGDSITQGVGVENIENVYLNRIKNEFSLKKANNYGISGTRFARQNVPSEVPSFDQDFCSRVDSMDPDADVIVVFGGTNDYGHGDAPIGEPGDRTCDTFWGACHELMSKLVTRYPGKPIVIMTPLHRLTEDEPNSVTGLVLEDYVNIICEVAGWYSLPVLDLNAESGLQPRVSVIQEKFVPDGLHPNDAGHEIIARCLAQFLRYQI